jgi:hypothetical protein
VPTRWLRGVIAAPACAVLAAGAAAAGAEMFAISYFNRENLPDPAPFTRFVFPTVGYIYDENGQSLIEFARDIWRDAAAPVVGEAVSRARTAALPRHASPEESDWLLHHATNIRAFSP